MPEQPSFINNRYQVLELIGAGGMGAVYRVHDRLMDMTVALKRVTTPNEQLITNTVSDPTKQSHLALATEFQTLASLRHPHIISVLDYGFDSEQFPFFTMELLEDAHIITELSASLSSQQKWQLIIQMLQALAYLHRRGILHRDLKPDNVMVTQISDGEYSVKVLDFGLAVAHNYAEPSDTLVGTLAYVAPEILQSSSATRESDLYAVGIMMYEMLSGQYPFEMTAIEDLFQSILYFRPRVNVPGIERQIGTILKRLLQKDPQKRYASAEDVMRDIADATEIELAIENQEIRESFLQSAQFVGRETELEKLQDALLSAKQQKGSLWLVEGESGVGKTRLLDEVRSIALVEGMTVLSGQAVSDGGLPYEVWRNIVRRLILSSDISDDQAGVLKMIAPELDRMLGRSITTATQLSETAQNERLIDVISQLIVEHPKPILLILEDLHWATDSLDPIVQILDKIPQLGLCIVASCRTDEQITLREQLPSAEVLRLNRLSHDEIVALSVSMVGNAANQTGVIDLVQRETEGNTFFIVEVMRALAEDAGQLDNIGRVTLPASVVTGGMNTVIERRFNHVPSQYHPLLHIAAVIGRRLDLQILEEALSRDNPDAMWTVDDWLGVCEAADVIRIRDEEWQFSHDKLREYLLQQIGDVPSIHQRVAEAIEAVYGDDLARYRSLAEHWLAAGDIHKAIHYGIPASKYMQDISHYHDAADLLYAIYRRWTLDDIDMTVQCDLFLRLGELHERTSEYEIAKDYFERSYALATEMDDTLRLVDVLYGKGLVAYDQSQYDASLTQLQSALEIGENLAKPETLAQVNKIISNIYSSQDNFQQSNVYLRVALDISREHDIKIEIAGCLNNLGVNAFLVGDHQTARDYYEQALEVYKSVGYRTGIALSLGNMGDVAYDEGFEKQLSYYEQALNIHRDVGNRWGIALCLENMASTYFMLDFRALAMQTFRDSLQIANKIGDRFGQQHMLLQMGFIHCLEGDYEQAQQALEKSLSLAKDLDLGMNYVLCLAHYGYYDISIGDLSRAKYHLAMALHNTKDIELSAAIYDVFSFYACLFQAHEQHQFALTLCIFLLAESTLDESLKKFILQPMHDTLKVRFTREEQEQLHNQAQTLTLKQIRQTISDNQFDVIEGEQNDAKTGR